MWKCENSYGNVHFSPDYVTDGEHRFLTYGAVELCEKLNALEADRDRLLGILKNDVADVLATHPDAHIGNKVVHYAYQKALSALPERLNT